MQLKCIALFALWVTKTGKHLRRILINSKQHNKFLLLAKAIYESFGKTESEISNAVNYKLTALVHAPAVCMSPAQKI